MHVKYFFLIFSIFSCKSYTLREYDLQEKICKIENINANQIRLDDDISWQELNLKLRNLEFDSTESFSRVFHKKKYNYSVVIDTIEKWNVSIGDSLKFVKNSNMRVNLGSYIFDVYNVDHNLFQMINSEKFTIQGKYDFDSTTNYYYHPDFYFVKPRYPIEIEYFGILKDTNYVFDYLYPLYFQNNFNACYWYYLEKYGINMSLKYSKNKIIVIGRIK